MYIKFDEYPPTPANTLLTDAALALLNKPTKDQVQQQLNVAHVADNIAAVLKTTSAVTPEIADEYQRRLSSQIEDSGTGSFVLNIFTERLTQGLLSKKPAGAEDV